jgi:uncharacterized membrane-anchored protein YitT (DUF2179 family)
MKVETLFNAGDRVFILHNNKIANVTIYSIDIKQSKDLIDVKCWFKFNNPSAIFGYDLISKQESEFFETKEQLIKSLE